MAATPEIARENGKKGGRPKGKKNASTIKAEEAKQLLIQAYLDNVQPINEKLVEMAKSGDLGAVKELHDRVYGKAIQPVDMKQNVNINVEELRITIQQNLATFRTDNQRERILPQIAESI